MRDFDDDARLRDMFGEFRTEVAPYVAPPGTAAARHWVRRRRRFGTAAIAAGAVLFVGGPAVGFVAATMTRRPRRRSGRPTADPGPDDASADADDRDARAHRDQHAADRGRPAEGQGQGLLHRPDRPI